MLPFSSRTKDITRPKEGLRSISLKKTFRLDWKERRDSNERQKSVNSFFHFLFLFIEQDSVNDQDGEWGRAKCN